MAGVSPTMLGKELDVLVAAGIAVDRMDGNRRMAQANPDCPIFDELRGIARKTAGLADIVRDAIGEVEGVELAFIFGSVARGQEKASSDVDLCVIGSARHAAVLSALGPAQASVGRPVNPIVYTPSEMREKMKEPSSFIEKMLASEKIFLVGDEDGLKRIADVRAQRGNDRRARVDR